jgi:hypothetical protein
MSNAARGARMRDRLNALRSARALLPAAMVLLLGACASVPPPPAPGSAATPSAPAAPALGWTSRIKVPDGHVPVLQLTARGVQVFRCEQRNGKEWGWWFRQPEALLSDARGQPAGRHGADFSFEHVDGSRLVGTVLASDAAPQDGDLRWLLLSTRSYGAGALAGVTHVQRINTRGGVPPLLCEARQAGQLLRVDFSADFVFYRPR